MDPDAYRQYEIESGNWLRRGRLSLLRRLLTAASLPEDAYLLEVGAGVGQNLPLLAEFGSVDAAEIDQIGLERLLLLDFVGTTYTEPIPFDLSRTYDVICALDVIEHLEDDRAAVRWIASGLNDGGHFIAAVPTYQWLFGDHDRALGHYRRYTRSSFLALLPPEFEVVQAGYFNSAVLPAVAVARMLGNLKGRLTRSKGEPRKQNSSLPAPVDRTMASILGFEARVFAKRPILPFGLSLFVVARKRTQTE